MRRRYRVVLTLFLLACLTASWTAAVAQDDDEKLRVATHTIEPFVMQEGDELVGFTVDYWDELADMLDVSYEWVIVDSVQDQLEAVQNGDVDLSIGAISINREREEVVDFSFPYFRSGLLIMTPYQHDSPIRNLMDLVRGFFSPAILQLLALLFGVMLIVAHIVWLVERSRNEDFDKNYLQGIWDGFWWAAVTVSTVGYGDKTAKGNVGRVISLLWIFVGLILITQLTAGVTATLAVKHLNSRISDVTSLKNHRVVTVEGTTSAEYLRKLLIWPITVDKIDDAFRLLEQGKVDAIVYDAPVLQYYAVTEGGNNVTVTNEPFHTEMYGIVLPTDSQNRDQINLAILAMIESGEYDTIYAKWFGLPPP